MWAQCSLSFEYTNILQTQAIVPRLNYSNDLVGQIILVLKNKKNEIKKYNKILLSKTEEDDPEFLKSIEIERKIQFCLEILFNIQKRLNSVSKIDNIPKIFPSLVPIIRIISAQLVGILPKSSQQLSELSVHVGSIILDSATITKAQFDFSQSNLDSTMLLDEVKLMVDSKINKQYPHLDFFKGIHA